MVLSLILAFGMVVYLESAPYFCSWQDELYCEGYLGGTFYYYFLWTQYYGDGYYNVYDIYCDYESNYEWWGQCIDIDEIY